METLPKKIQDKIVIVIEMEPASNSEDSQTSDPLNDTEDESNPSEEQSCLLCGGISKNIWRQNIADNTKTKTSREKAAAAFSIRTQDKLTNESSIHHNTLTSIKNKKNH